MSHYYRQGEFAIRIGVDRHTLSKWKKDGKICPIVNTDGKEIYTEEQAKEYEARKVSLGIKRSDEENWINLSDLVVDQARKRVDWKKSVEKRAHIEFCFKGIIGELTLIDINNHTLTIEHEGINKLIQTSALINNSMSKMVGFFSKEYKYSPGTVIKMGKTNITILEQERKNDNQRRAYKYICNKCKCIDFIDEYNISNKGCCPVCYGARVVEGVNDIAHKAPWMLPFFQDKTIAKERSCNSALEVYFICPDCGRPKEKPMKIGTLYRTKSIGCVCGDGISYPNKYMYSVLEQLLEQGKIEQFTREFNKEWLNKRKFDFEVIIGGTQYIFEMDGGLGHGNRTFDKSISPQETKNIDQWKDEQAIKNGYVVVRIDANASEGNYIKSNIIGCLSEIVDLSEIDWDEADRFALSNVMKKVCFEYNANPEISYEELSRKNRLGVDTIRRYIKKGSEYGWCIYDKDKNNEKKWQHSRDQTKEKEKRIIEVCEYYMKNKPILASEIATTLGYDNSTILRYLDEGVSLGFEPYDREYSMECNKTQIRNLKKRKTKSVLCFDLNGEFVKRYGSVTEAAREHGVAITAISNCCKKNGTLAGFIFRYE